MLPRVGWFVFALLPGCYSPSYGDCQVTCASGFGCPSGLTCDNDVHACRAPAMVGRACGSPDVPGIDASCAWAGIYPASNVDPCNPLIPSAIPAMTVSMTSTFDTDHGTWITSQGTVDLPGGFVSSLWVIHAASFTVDIGAIVTLAGKTPLVIVADSTISIAANFDATAPSLAEFVAECGTPDGEGGGLAGQGGGGGGYAVNGANGGATEGLGLRTGEPSNGKATLATLRPGCKGGDGGSPSANLAGGLGGAAGGAFGLIAGESIEITDHGTLLAGGGGGGAGSTAVACAATPCSSGGGGGGTGGSILLEAPTITIDGGICAAGGGGGQGGVVGQTAGSAPNADACHEGEPGSGPGTLGGQGGNTNIPTGMDGGSSGTDSGGGGGGSVGRIYLHALNPLVMGPNLFFLPLPTTQVP